MGEQELDYYLTLGWMWDNEDVVSPLHEHEIENEE
jgi:hypothetical protein